MIRSGSAVQTKGSGSAFLLGEEAIDRYLEVNQRVEHASFETTLGKFGEEALDRIKPGAGRWREVEGEARVAIEPFADLRMLVSGIVVEVTRTAFPAGSCASIVLRKRINSWCRWRCMLRPMTVPSRTFSAAKSAVVPLRL